MRLESLTIPLNFSSQYNALGKLTIVYFRTTVSYTKESTLLTCVRTKFISSLRKVIVKLVARCSGRLKSVAQF